METNTTTQIVKTKSHKKLFIALGFIFLLALIVCIGLSALIIMNANKSANNEQENQENNLPDEETDNLGDDTKEENHNDAYEQYLGTYLSARIPEGWLIKEYTDETGMYQYAQTEGVTFSGLTGLEILDENLTVLFSLSGVDGIGGGGGCEEIGVFSDTEASYVQDVKNQTDELGFTPTLEIDLTNAEYSEIFTMGLRFRRVGNVLYYATTENQTVFNTACGLESQFVKIDELNFTVDDENGEYTANAYGYGINSTVTDPHTLEHLDEVLNSIVVK